MRRTYRRILEFLIGCLFGTISFLTYYYLKQINEAFGIAAAVSIIFIGGYLTAETSGDEVYG